MVHDLVTVNRVIKAAKAAAGLPLPFSPVRPPYRLVLFTDASSITLASATTQTGFLVFLAHEDSERGALSADTGLVLLAWGAHRQRRVTHSSFAAEAYALLDCMRAAIEVACLLSLILDGVEGGMRPIDAVVDSLSLFNTLSSTSLVRPKEVNAGVEALRVMYAAGHMASVSWTPADGQLADCFTKASSSASLKVTLRTGRYGLSPVGTMTKTHETDREDLTSRPNKATGGILSVL